MSSLNCSHFFKIKNVSALFSPEIGKYVFFLSKSLAFHTSHKTRTKVTQESVSGAPNLMGFHVAHMARKKSLGDEWLRST